MPTGIKIKDAMVSKVITAAPTQTVLEATRTMKKDDVGSVIIIDNGKPVGIVTREDIINKVTSEDKQPSKMLLKDVMSNTLVTCDPENDISDVAKVMSKHGYERVPVVSEGKLVGIISAREIASVAPAVIEVLTEHIRIEEPQHIDKDVMADECELCGNFSENLHMANGKWVCDNCKEEAEL